MAIKDTLKKVPTPVWIAGGGVVAGLGYAAFRSKKGETPTEPDPADLPTELTAVDDEYQVLTPGNVPGGVIVQPDTGETVGAVGQTALETALSGYTAFFENLPEFITAIGGLSGGGAAGGSADTGAIPDMPATPPPAAAPIPQPRAPAPQKPPHYHSGSNVAGKSFPGATGWIEIPTSNPNFRDFHIAWPPSRGRLLQRWRLHTRNHDGQKKGTWDKISGDLKWGD